MKKLALFFMVLFSSILFSQKNKKEYDYIKDYYQLVYEAQYNYEIGNDTLAYSLLKKAESNCPMLDQKGIYEKYKYLILSVKYKKTDKIYKLMSELIEYEGYKFETFENDSLFDYLKSSKKWRKFKKKSVVLMSKFDAGINYQLRAELIKMRNLDQASRGNGYTDDTKKADSINELKMKAIIKACDCFPVQPKLIGTYKITEENPDFSVFVFHIQDVKYWQPVFYDLVKRGKAPADIVGNLIDSNQRMSGMFYYGVYQNITPDRIIDFDKIDERRIAVGLSTWDLQKKMYDILMKEWENAN